MRTAILVALILPMAAISQEKPNEPASQPVKEGGAQPSTEAKKEDTPNQADIIAKPQPQEVTVSGGDLVKVGAVAGAVGGIISAIIGALVAYWNRAHEDRKQIRELAMQMALEKWRAATLDRQRRYEWYCKDEERDGRRPNAPPPPPVLADVVKTMYDFMYELETARRPGLWSRIRSRFKSHQ